MDIAERLRASVEAHAWPERPVTISLGVAAWTRRMVDVRDLVDSADTALYASKAKGRNSVSSAADTSNPAPDQPLRADQSVCA
jgi:diguanylate cyclase (GGDEF)-like protein